MKILGLMIVFNEEEYVYCSLKSVMDFCDEIIVVEGPVKIFKDITKATTSTDNTINEIKRAMKEDENKKIKLFSGRVFENKESMKNFGLSKSTIDQDYLFVIDGDEVYKKEDLETIKLKALKNKYLKSIKFPFYHFWHDFNHIATSEPFSKYHSRFTSFYEGCEFKVHFALGDKFTNRIDTEEKYKGMIFYFPNDPSSPHTYHYGYVKPKDKILNKLCFYEIRDKRNTNNIEQIKEKIKRESSWFNWNFEIGKEHGVERFSGTHPDIIIKNKIKKNDQ